MVLVLLAGVAAGALNAVGGGGTFVALPALVAAGLPPVTANAASTVALMPAAAASAWVYRRDVRPVGSTSMWRLAAASMGGGAVGAVLLLALPSASFDAAVPWLLASATLVLAFGRSALRAVSTVLGRPLGMSSRGVLAWQFVLAVYGGYFGGAVGILMMAVWGIGLGLDPATSNPMRVTQLAAVNVTAAMLFLFASDVLTAPLLPAGLLVGALVGGIAGAYVARRLPARLLRAVVLATAATMTVLYFLRGQP
jgi:uncharacterized membrane protein YfcA